MTFPCARKLENICCGHKMFLNKIRNIFVRAGKRGNICVGNNVSSFASTLLHCDETGQASRVFYYNVIHSLGFFMCFMISILHAQNNTTCFYYVLYFDKTWILTNQSACRVYSIYYNLFQVLLKDVRANCFCASLLRTQIHKPRHP